MTLEIEGGSNVALLPYWASDSIRRLRDGAQQKP